MKKCLCLVHAPIIKGILGLSSKLLLPQGAFRHGSPSSISRDIHLQNLQYTSPISNSSLMSFRFVRIILYAFLVKRSLRTRLLTILTIFSLVHVLRRFDGANGVPHSLHKGEIWTWYPDRSHTFLQYDFSSRLRTCRLIIIDFQHQSSLSCWRSQYWVLYGPYSCSSLKLRSTYGFSERLHLGYPLYTWKSVVDLWAHTFLNYTHSVFSQFCLSSVLLFSP